MGKKNEIVRFGTLNPVNENVLQERFDPATTDVLRELSVEAGKKYSADAFANVKVFKGVVVDTRNNLNGTDWSIGSLYSEIFGSEDTYYQPNNAYRVYIPELFNFGELPDIVAKNNGGKVDIPEAVQNDINLYPWFYPASKLYDEGQAAIGEIVYVDFVNRKNLNVDSDPGNNLFLGRVVEKSLFVELSDEISAQLTNAKEAFTDCLGKVKQNIIPVVATAAALPKRVNSNKVADLKPGLVDRILRWDENIRDAISRLGADLNVFPYVRGFISVESAGNPNAISSTKAVGLMQFTSIAAETFNQQFGVEKGFSWNSTNPNDPRYDPLKSIDAGTKFINLLYSRHDGNPYVMYAAYNIGSGWAKNTFTPYLKQKYPNTQIRELTATQVKESIQDLKNRGDRFAAVKDPNAYNHIFAQLDSWLQRGTA